MIITFMAEPTESDTRKKYATLAGAATIPLVVGGAVLAGKGLLNKTPEIATQAASGLGKSIGQGLGLAALTGASSAASRYLPDVVKQVDTVPTIPSFLDHPILST